MAVDNFDGYHIDNILLTENMLLYRTVMILRRRCNLLYLAVIVSNLEHSINKVLMQTYMSRDMRFLTMLYVRPAKPQISLRICAVRSEPLLVACIFFECKATDWTSFGVSKLKRSLHRLV